MQTVEKQAKIVTHYKDKEYKLDYIVASLKEQLEKMGFSCPDIKDKKDISSKANTVTNILNKDYLGDKYEEIVDTIYKQLIIKPDAVKDHSSFFLTDKEKIKNFDNIESSEQLQNFLMLVLEEIQEQISRNQMRLYFSQNMDEKELQPLLKFMFMAYCNLKEILIIEQPRISNGSLDFLFAKDAYIKVLVELKLSKNKSIGVEQLIEYIKGEAGAEYGIVVTLAWGEKDKQKCEEELKESLASPDRSKIKSYVIDCAAKSPTPSSLNG